VQGKKTVMTTTNGTRAINKVVLSRNVLIGCFLNAEACCQSALDLAHKHNTGIGIVCAGTKGKFALDDALGAGYLIKTLLRIGNQDIIVSDAAIAAKRLYEVYPNIEKGFMDSTSGKRLVEINHEQDLTCCSMVNIFHVVPILVKDTPCYFKRLE
jgi:2-phosphosulfolactate phosphatase